MKHLALMGYVLRYSECGFIGYANSVETDKP